MPWELTVVYYPVTPLPRKRTPNSPDERPLGSKQAVWDRISALFPDVEWHHQQSVLDMINSMPDHPFHALMPTWSEETRASFARPQVRGILERGDLCLEFCGFELEPVQFFFIDVRGNDNPLPLLRHLAQETGWSVVDMASQQILDLESGAVPHWDAFRDWRDGALGGPANMKRISIDP